MKQYKNPAVYAATFRGLQIVAFGIRQLLEGTYHVRVYQVRADPELWKCSPGFAKGNLAWEAETAEKLCSMISGNFQEQLTEWELLPAPAPARRSLTNGAQEAIARRRNRLGA